MLPRLSLCCRPRLVRRAVTVIAVRAHMVVGDIRKFLYGLVQFILRPKFIEVGTFVLEGVEVPLHWRIVVWVSGFAHALFAEFTALLGDAGFGYTVLCGDAFVGSPFLLMEPDNLLLKFGSVVL